MSSYVNAAILWRPTPLALELGAVYGALANLESNVGSIPQAIKFEETALRYKYQIPNPSKCTVSQFNLATYLLKSWESLDTGHSYRTECACRWLSANCFTAKTRRKSIW